MADPTPQPEPQPAPTPAPEPEPKPDEFKPIESQAHLDSIVQARLDRERKKYADYDEAKKKAEQFDKIQSEQQTELEREKAAREKAEQEAADTKAQAKEVLLRASVVAEAAKRNVHDPNAAYALLDKSAIEYDDDGNPKNVDKAMDTLLEASPWLVNAGGVRRDPADLGARGGGGKEPQLSRDDLKTMTPEQISEARKKGQLTELGVSA